MNEQMESLIVRYAVAGLMAGAALTAIGQVVPKLPTIEEGQEARENCLGHEAPEDARASRIARPVQVGRQRLGDQRGGVAGT
jgi:hypothetical protein